MRFYQCGSQYFIGNTGSGKMSNTGTYIIDKKTGKLVKISDRATTAKKKGHTCCGDCCCHHH